MQVFGLPEININLHLLRSLNNIPLPREGIGEGDFFRGLKVSLGRAEDIDLKTDIANA